MSKFKFQFDAWKNYFQIINDEKSNESDANTNDKTKSIETNDDKNFDVLCLLCKPKNKVLCVSKISSWNLKSHVQKIHAEKSSEIFNSVEKYKQEFNNKRKGDHLGLGADRPKKEKQLKLNDSFNKTKTNSVTQNQLNKLIVATICDAMLPHSIVENKSFRMLLEAGFPDRDIIGRKPLTGGIKDDFKLMQEDIKDEFKKLDSVCLTADSWTSYRRAFIGMTAHWICTNTFKRKSFALACKRIIGKQTGEVLATKIDEIIGFYGLHGKVVKIITDNGKNYIKAFKIVDEHLSDDESDTEEDEDLFNPKEITDILTDYRESPSTTTKTLLPPHERCGAHTLNLVMSKDMPVGIQNCSQPFKLIYNSTISKCQALFNKQNRSSKVADAIKEKIGRYLITPVTVRWNSEHHSLKLISELYKTKPAAITSVFEILQLPAISNEELSFLHEYVKVVDIVANALNIMQGENYMYTGLYTPTLIRLLKKLDCLSELRFCRELCSILKDAIKKRFPSIMDEKFIKSTIIHPFFKNFTFLENERANVRLRNKMINELVDELANSSSFKNMQYNQDCNRNNVTSIESFKILTNFFKDSADDCDVIDKQPELSCTQSADRALRNYLWSNDDSLESLINFPFISNIFIKYNTALLSSAAVERLFSKAKNILKMNRCSLSDQNVEMQLLLKVNKYNK